MKSPAHEWKIGSLSSRPYRAARAPRAHGMLPFTRAEILVLAILLFGSFGLTLWLTAPGRPLSASHALTPAERLATYPIATEYALHQNAQALGLQISPSLTGFVDSVERLNGDTVSAKGWLADRTGDGEPSYILAFVGGKFATSARTHGQRPDVTKSLGLTAKAAQNVAYAMTFRCEPGSLPILVGLSADRYVQLTVKPCP
jgi:hypothetical protein